MVGLNFSCDGSHYMPWGQLLEKSLGFWLGTGESAMDGERQENSQQLGGRGKDAYTNTAPSDD
jgi:hypothetical protein